MKVIQLRREKGFKLPPNTIVVSRRTKWGNPFRTARSFQRWLEEDFVVWHELIDDSTLRFELDLWRARILAELETLRKADYLACWCHDWDGEGENPLYCHADVYIKLLKDRENLPV